MIGHMQAVKPLPYAPLNKSDFISMSNLLDELWEDCDGDAREEGYVYPFDENSPDWATFKITTEDSLIPTADADYHGYVVNFKGKEYVVYYDDVTQICVGHGGVLKCFEGDHSFTDDMMFVINEIFGEQVNA